MALDKIIPVLIILVGILATMLFGKYNSIPFLIPIVFAHCDTMDGPVIADARQALEKADVTPVLKWVKK